MIRGEQIAQDKRNPRVPTRATKDLNREGISTYGQQTMVTPKTFEASMYLPSYFCEQRLRRAKGFCGTPLLLPVDKMLQTCFTQAPGAGYGVLNPRSLLGERGAPFFVYDYITLYYSLGTSLSGRETEMFFYDS